MKTRICINCKIEKELNEINFYLEKDSRKNEFYFKKICKDCQRILKKEYYQKNKSKILTKNTFYNKDYKKKYSVKLKRSVSEKERRKTDLNFRIRDNISSIIKSNLKRNNGIKGNESFKKYLPYSLDDFKSHIASQFESWMTWENWGVYDSKTWNDNDQITWTWQIDHIIPHSKFKYVSMEDEEFQKCWSLENLRPYSAKQNIIDGANKKRH